MIFTQVLYTQIGTGDPSLGSSRWNQTKGDTIMNQWMNLMLSANIRDCRGIVTDLSAWPGRTQTVPDGYPWGGLG